MISVWQACARGTRLSTVEACLDAIGEGLSVDPAEVGRVGIEHLLSMLADPVRVRIVYALDTVDELCVGDLALALDLPEHTIGYGLRMLRTAGLLATRKSGRMVYYRLTDDFPEPLREHCLRRLIDLSRTTDGNPSQPDDQ